MLIIIIAKSSTKFYDALVSFFLRVSLGPISALNVAFASS